MTDITYAHVTELEQIAKLLVARVRDFDPEDNGHWLRLLLPDPADWFRLAFVLAAAVPDDQSWTQLTAWTKQTVLEAVDPECGTPEAALMHVKRREPLDQPCEEALAEYRQQMKASHRRRRNAGFAAASHAA